MKECIDCSIKETPQWYSGPKCKSCYRKQHREGHKEAYQQRDKTNYENNKEFYKVRQKTYYVANAAKIKKDVKAHRDLVGAQRRDGYIQTWRESNREKCSNYTRAYKSKYPEKVKKSQDSFVKRNLHKYAEREARKRASQLDATPKWLNADQLAEIKQIYKNCPSGFHVDHIVPLLGQNVRGLHVPWNLQYLPALENMRKGNKF